MFGSTFISAAAALFFLAPMSFAAPVAVPSTSDVSQISSLTTVVQTWTDKIIVVQNAVQGLDIQSQEPDVLAIYAEHLVTVQTDLSDLISVIKNLDIKLSIGGAPNMNPAVAVEVKGLVMVVAKLVVTIFNILTPVLALVGGVVEDLPKVVAGLVGGILSLLGEVLQLLGGLVPTLLALVLPLLGGVLAFVTEYLAYVFQIVVISQ